MSGVKFVAVCAHCHKVREGTVWVVKEVVETPVVKISHGLCNDCLLELYPDLFEEWELKRVPRIYAPDEMCI